MVDVTTTTQGLSISDSGPVFWRLAALREQCAEKTAASARRCFLGGITSGDGACLKNVSDDGHAFRHASHRL